MRSDAQLLRRYAEGGDEAAFSELVARHTGMVYAAACRQTNSADLAQDVAQMVFIALARQARRLSGAVSPKAGLAGWLCRCAHNQSLNLRRNQQRRQARESEAMERLQTNACDIQWEAVRPILDEALSELSEPEHDALVMRYFGGQDYRSIGEAMESTTDAAQKRVARGLEKLRERLGARGRASTVGALAALLEANALTAAPVSLAARLAAVALSGAGTGAATIQVMTMTTLQKACGAALVALAAGLFMHEARLRATWSAQTQILQGQYAAAQAQAAQAGRERDDLARRWGLVNEENARLRSNSVFSGRTKKGDVLPGDPAMLEFARRVALLKAKLEQMPEKRIPELQFLQPKDWADAVAEEDLTTDDGIRCALSKLRQRAEDIFLNDMMKGAIKNYLAANGNVLPSDLPALKPYFTQPVTDEMLQRYELLQSGTPNNEANLVKLSAPPADTDYDSTHVMSINGASGSQFNRVQQAVEVAVLSYQAANGALPTDPSQLVSYLKSPIDPATVQKYMAQQTANPPPPDVWTVMPALNAYREANNGDAPDNALQVALYLTTSAQQNAFLRLVNAPPTTAALLPAVSAYAAAHEGQTPQKPGDLSPYLSSPEQQAALNALIHTQNNLFP